MIFDVGWGSKLIRVALDYEISAYSGCWNGISSIFQTYCDFYFAFSIHDVSYRLRLFSP